MPLAECLNEKCKKLIDVDGYVEHGVPTLFFCECGKVYDKPKFGKLVEVPKEEVDLSSLEGKWPDTDSVPHVQNRGIFIKKSRWKLTEKQQIERYSHLESLKETKKPYSFDPEKDELLINLKEKLMALRVGLGADNTRKGIPEDELKKYI